MTRNSLNIPNFLCLHASRMHLLPFGSWIDVLYKNPIMIYPKNNHKSNKSYTQQETISIPFKFPFMEEGLWQSWLPIKRFQHKMPNFYEADLDHFREKYNLALCSKERRRSILIRAYERFARTKKN